MSASSQIHRLHTRRAAWHLNISIGAARVSASRCFRCRVHTGGVRLRRDGSESHSGSCVTAHNVYQTQERTRTSEVGFDPLFIQKLLCWLVEVWVDPMRLQKQQWVIRGSSKHVDSAWLFPHKLLCLRTPSAALHFESGSGWVFLGMQT